MLRNQIQLFFFINFYEIKFGRRLTNLCFCLKVVPDSFLYVQIILLSYREAMITVGSSAKTTFCFYKARQPTLKIFLRQEMRTILRYGSTEMAIFTFSSFKIPIKRLVSQTIFCKSQLGFETRSYWRIIIKNF